MQNWSVASRDGARGIGHVKLSCSTADGTAIRGRGVELHITQRLDPSCKNGALRDV